jgi:hypothetical protein
LIRLDSSIWLPGVFTGLEDLFAFHNWQQLVSWRRLFPKRMTEDIKEGQANRDAFNAFDAALQETALELVEGWKKWVHTWESHQHTDSTESPFELKEKGESPLSMSTSKSDF